MSFLREVHEKRKKLADVLLDEEYSGIREIVEELYPDRAHFIYELLQNAEDARATEASFELHADRLVFRHNGRAFSKDDVWGITNIGKGSKRDEDDKIGRFGVGFKSVFAYSETPLIWSPTYSFRISGLVLPEEITPIPQLNGQTQFEFPFNNPKKEPGSAYDEIRTGLDELAETTLLFLTTLESISWRIGDAESGVVLRIQHSDHHIEVLKQIGSKTTESCHFLKFSAPVHGLEKQNVAVAFELDFLPNIKQFDSNLPIAKQLRITSASSGSVAVFFPAEKETSGLRFHLHAPFVPELSRASIKETPANKPLFDQLAELAASSLHKVRDHGLLTAEFLAVLPNRQEQIPPRYEGIRESVILAMNTEPLTPTHDRSHAPARFLLQAKASLKSLLSEADLEYLVDYDDEAPRWAVGATQKNTNTDRFLASLDIKDWGIEEFVELLADRASEGRRYIPRAPYFVDGPDPEFLEWLTSKPTEWHQQLYALLYSELAPEGDLYRLKNSRIVRLSDDTYGTGGTCFFPEEAGQDDKVLPRVTESVYSSGKSRTQQHNARKFLEEIGVRVVGEAEQVEVILNQRYTREAEIPDEKTYLRDLKRFITLVEKEPNCAKLFKDYYIFESEGDQWCQPSQVYLDEPFLETGLRAYYKAQGDDAELFALDGRYQSCGVSAKKIAAFAKVVGARAELGISKRSCYSNPEWDYLRNVGGERHTSPLDIDYTIPGLADLLKTPSLGLSKLIWRTMCTLPNDGRYLVATYRRNMSAGSRQANSTLVHVLRNAAWVPQGNNLFARPAEASRDLLPEGFAFDPGQRWLKAIKWGEEVVKRSEHQRQKETFAKELGFIDEGSLQRAQRFAALSPEDQERILADEERRAVTELPEHEPSSPDRRAQRVGAMAAEAPGRRTEVRNRSVSVGLDAVKEAAGQYLSQQYTNSDGEMICQACRKRLPFKLDDGTSYFERVQLMSELKKHHYQNYLALCPNHAAMFQYTNGSRDQLKGMIIQASANELEIILAQQPTQIYFTKTHLSDLRALIAAEDEHDDSQGGDDE
ncbi:hypothetical protein P7L66_12580 [Tistrella mobilis]|uniref:sacsin N-terminal ATP-binding-like domain-containing protein n=1 Tax=Tistrella mobilis TaxID=171437 RepID=UPI00355612F2